MENVESISATASPRVLVVGIVVLASLILFSGCAQTNSLLKASAAERAGFIPSVLPLTAERQRSPFHGVWYKNEDMFYQRREEVTKLVLLPVRTDFLLEKGWWSELNSLDREGYEADVKELARYFDQQLRDAFAGEDMNRWEIVDSPDQDCLIVEYALVEVIATKVHINAIGTTLGFLVPGGGLVSRAGGGSIAFEANVYDGKDGELLVSFADREADKLAIATLKDYQFYAHARESIREWSEQFALIVNSERDFQVTDSLPVTAAPW